MFLFILYFLLNVRTTLSTIIVQNAGLYEISSDDIAMLFYLTVENTFDCQIRLEVQNIECVEGDPYLESSSYMHLIGGDMGFIASKTIKNITLIYPNFYLRNRIGRCLVAIHFKAEQHVEEIRREIYFESNRAFVHDGSFICHRCETYDLDDIDDCSSVDCVIKYNSKRSYFDKERKLCQSVPKCPPSAVYIPRSNVCRKLHEPVCESDLELIEDGYFESSHIVSNLVNLHCHNGYVVNQTGECICDDDWTTSTCSEGLYHPTMNLYHMCNIEINSWERANREKLLMTILVLVVVALAVAAKMLVAVCLLNWCCHFIRKRRKDNDDELCPYSFCGNEECPAKDPSKNKPCKTIMVSFSNIDAASTADDSDISISIDDKSESKSSKSKAQIKICPCK